MVSTRIRILMVDDHAMVRAGVRTILEREPDIEVVGEASTGEEGIALCRTRHPDLILLDISMPGIGGLAAARILRAEMPEVRVLFLTMHDEDKVFFEALQVGAGGYVVKTAHPAELLSAVRAVRAGEIFVSPAVARTLVADYLSTRPAPSDGLTPREREVLGGIVDGLTTLQIAEKLAISPATVQTHRVRVLARLGLHSQTDLIKYAVRKGLLKVSP